MDRVSVLRHSRATRSLTPIPCRTGLRQAGEAGRSGSNDRGPGTVREFTIIEELITTYVMPPRLTAELYRVLGEIPGVSVDTHAVDVAGRPGIGFRHSVQPAAGAEEIIIDPAHLPADGSRHIGQALA